MDTAGNLTQIGQWTIYSFAAKQQRIELFLMLTRKNLNALSTFPLSADLNPSFMKFSASYTKLEEEYRTGIPDRLAWANLMLTWGTTLLQKAQTIA